MTSHDARTIALSGFAMPVEHQSSMHRPQTMDDPRRSAFDRLLDLIGRRLAEQLETPQSGYEPFTPSDPETLQRTLRPADVLLVEGHNKLSTTIKYLTQSSWSHSALYFGDALDVASEHGERGQLIEANLAQGVVAIPLTKYRRFNTRICRPVGLTDDERLQVVRFAEARLGRKYDTRHVVDLGRYLLPSPRFPVRWRRRAIAFGSGDPTRTICSTLIAEAFESVRYPILPRIEQMPDHPRADSPYSRDEILHIHESGLYTPRDFDLSPYFQIVKPAIESGFDPHRLRCADDTTQSETSAPASNCSSVSLNKEPNQ